MQRRRRRMTPEERAAFVAKARGEKAARATGYRDRALALFPHVCARCGRAFSGANLRELTVHHKDHNHHNNPPDGSNWELLCVYCHDNEHQDPEQRGHYDPAKGLAKEDMLGHNPFDQLASHLKPDAAPKDDGGGDG